MTAAAFDGASESEALQHFPDAVDALSDCMRISDLAVVVSPVNPLA